MNARWAAEPGVAVVALAGVWCRAYGDEPAAAELELVAFDELAAEAFGMGRPGMEAEGSVTGWADALALARPLDFGVAGFDDPELGDSELEDSELEDPELEDPELEDAGLEAAGLDDAAVDGAAADAAGPDDASPDPAAVDGAELDEAALDAAEPAGTPGMAAATDEAWAEAEPDSAEPADREPG